MFPSASQLDSFTDVFGDEIAVDENLSQPFSLPTTCDTPPSSLHVLATNSEKIIRPLKHTGQHGEFRSVEEIDPKYRCLFTYPYFNLVQSRVIEDALYSDVSLVVCAPTGSGKTVVFELAILQLLMQVEDQRTSQDFKIIYMAPVKAVCSERLAEWYPKLTRLGLLCIEATGDTDVEFAQLAPYKVIITTPEKWDILTRRWRDHRALVASVKLFLIDEVHVLHDEARGPALEAVVSRMKAVESAAQSAHRIEQLQQQLRGDVTRTPAPRVRFVAASATVGNPEDVAEWLGTRDKPAVYHKFGEECRPVKLQRIVEGYPCAEGTSIFKFDLILNYKLWPIIQKYYNGKPTLIFCNTRKSVALTAEALSREVTVSFTAEQKAKLTALASRLKNKKLQSLVLSGVGCHHAGLLYEERLLVERAFRDRDLPILITTTTLAMGVNLPAHLVIVKNTQQYVNGAYQEYAASTVLQMLGRAGRPQFDAAATAVIMTRLQDKVTVQEYAASTVLQMLGRAGRPQFDAAATAVIMTRLQDKVTVQEYAASTVLQMLGRAGRPQFDAAATAVIMTRLQDKVTVQEYAASTVLQMLGRAGRPQFDAAATAVIMTRLQDKVTVQEYAASTVLQMLGRAGRPQFDAAATAVIMTRLQDKVTVQEYAASTVLQMLGRAGRPQFDAAATAVIMTRLQDKVTVQEYAASTVLQMLGRAGRPQFDAAATAVIMTRLQDKPRYQALVGGSEPLQSFLHKRLAENLNSEAALGTVADVAQCVGWLRSTFLAVRAAKDPKRYLGLPPAAPAHLIEKKIEELCVKAMNSLASSGLITMDEASCIESTEAGRLMSLFYMDVETMKNIMKIDGSESLERLLWLVCESRELSELHLRVDERRCLNLLNRNNKAPTIRFPMKGKITTRQMKLNCIIQATLGCLPIPEPSLNQEAMKVMRTASRVCKCIVRYVTRPELIPQPPYFSAVLNSIVLSKCMEAHLWENSPYVSKQLRGIGPALSALLAGAGLASLGLLEQAHPRDLERIMNKGPPAGNIIRKQVSLLPKYQLTITPIDSRSVTVQLMLLNHAHLSENMSDLTAGANHRSYLVVGDSENNLLLLTQFTDKDLIGVYDGTMKYDITRKLSTEHKIYIHCVSSAVVGIDAQADYLFLDLEPHIPRDEHWSNSNISRKNVVSKQAAITDVYKERKRKNDCDITQCKEKKKREDTLTQKLKALKESFGKTSKALKTDIDKSVALSNKAIHDLFDGKSIPDSPANVKEVAIKSPTVDLTKDVVFDPMEKIIIDDDDDNIDDIEFDSILSKIESEISGNDPISKNIPRNNAHDIISTMASAPGTTRPTHDIEQVDLTKTNISNTPRFVNESGRSVKDSKRQKNINMKTNYSFIDLIEKKHTDDKDKITDKSIDSGFSEAIKCQINKFLQRAQTTTKQTIPEIDELIQAAEHEELPEIYVKSSLASNLNTEVKGNEEENLDYSKELPEVYVKCPLTSDPNTSVKGDGQDYIECRSDNLIVTSRSPSVRDNVKTNVVDLNDENYGFVENLDSVEINVKSPKPLTTNAESQGHTTDMNFKKPDKFDLDEMPKDTKLIEENNDYSQGFDVPPNKPLFAICTDSPTHHYKDSCGKLRPDVNITCDTILPVNSVKTLVNASNNAAKAVVPYNHKVEDKVFENKNNREHMSTRLFKSLIPSPCPQNLFEQDNTMVDKLPNPYEYDHQNVSKDIEISRNNPNCVLSNQMVTIQSSVTNLKRLTNNEHLTRINCKPMPIVNRIGHLSDTKYTVIQNQKKDYTENKYSPSNTTPREAWHQNEPIQPNITNLKHVPYYDDSSHNTRSPSSFSFNVPNVVNRIEDISNPNHMAKHESPENDNKEETHFKKFSYTATKVDVCTKKYAPDHELRITRKLKVDVDITEIVKQDKARANKTFNGDYKEHGDTKAKPNNKITNQYEIVTQANNTKSEDIVTNKSNHNPDNVDARNKTLGGIEEKPESSTANNSIENILHKYSRILAKPETQHTQAIDKINKKIDGNTTVGPRTTYPSVTKSRKPFRISDINTINVPLIDNLTIAKRSAPIASSIDIAVPTVKVTKETTQNLETHKLNKDLIAKNDDYNDKSSESPVSVHSLQLDPLEDIKDDSMFNPKLLLQYFTEGQEVTDIIPPPASFSDSPVYSPTTEDQTRTGFYENPEFSVQYSNEDTENFNNYSEMDNSSDLQLSPNERETWCLSRDDTYDSPVASSPWSQRAQSSRGLGSRRAKLCQFKFVRKKAFRH